LLVISARQRFSSPTRHNNRENCNSFAHSCINWTLMRSHEEEREQTGFLAHEPKSHALLQTRACSQSPPLSRPCCRSCLSIHETSSFRGRFGLESSVGSETPGLASIRLICATGRSLRTRVILQGLAAFRQRMLASDF
jgi:hypothetical protein